MGSGVTVGSAALGTPAARKQAGRFALLRQLVADGVTCLFGNPGSSEQNLLEALRDGEFRSITYYLALHEGTAVAMADSYARARQQPTVGEKRLQSEATPVPAPLDRGRRSHGLSTSAG